MLTSLQLLSRFLDYKILQIFTTAGTFLISQVFLTYQFPTPIYFANGIIRHETPHFFTMILTCQLTESVYSIHTWVTSFQREKQI